jgi:dihydropteroate synthase
MIGEGADIIDVGGESTRPFSEPVAEKDELNRVIPVIETLRANPDILISVDTTRRMLPGKPSRRELIW